MTLDKKCIDIIEMSVPPSGSDAMLHFGFGGRGPGECWRDLASCPYTNIRPSIRKQPVPSVLKDLKPFNKSMKTLS
jgi:hypothetical protein